MQIYPMNFWYAAICLVMITVSVFAGDYINYYLGVWWVGLTLSLVPICFLCAAIGFVLMAVHLEVWDYPYLGRRL